MEKSSIIFRFEVQGRVSSTTHNEAGNAYLVSTIMNGTHIINLNNPLTMSTCHARSVETFPHSIIGGDPVISSCFLSADSYIAVGSSVGSIAIVSRSSLSVVKCYTFPDEAPVLSLKEVPHEPSLLLSALPNAAQIIDVERAAVRMSLNILKPRVVGTVAVTRNSFAVANYDGKVLLYDARCGCDPVTILAVPDQITSVAVSPASGALVAGTVGGRVFVMRCLMNKVREEAFGTGKIRAPIRCVAVTNRRIAAGDISAKLTLIDSSDNPGPTMYWDSHSLLPQHTVSASKTTTTPSSWVVPAVSLCTDTLWSALTSPDSAVSHVVALPV